MSRLLLHNERILTHGKVTVPDELSVHKYSFPICGDILRRLVAANPDLEISPLLRERLGLILAKQNDLKMIKSKLDTDGDARLYPYQRVGVEWLLGIKKGILCDPVGSGKTVEIASACDKIPGVLRVGVICPNSGISGWLYHVDAFFRQGSQWSDKSRGVAGIHHSDHSETTIVNYDNINYLPNDLDILIVDECHRVRNRKVQALSEIRRLSRKVEYLILATATPVINFDHDMWTLLNLCDPARFSSFWSHVFRFHKVSDNGFGIQIGGIKESERDGLLRMISTYSLCRPDCINLPGVTEKEVRYELEGEHLKLYKEMEDSWVSSLEDKSVSAGTMVAKITRLRQLAVSPRLLFTNFRGKDKIDVLLEIVMNREDSMIIFSSFKCAIDMVKERLRDNGISCEVMVGSTPREERTNLIKRFGDDFRILAMTLKTGGEAIDLIQSNKVIILDPPWHYAGKMQAIGRSHRIGQIKPVEVSLIVSKDTIEEVIYEIVNRKQNMTMNDLISRYKSSR